MKAQRKGSMKDLKLEYEMVLELGSKVLLKK